MNAVMNFTREDLTELKKAYRKAVDNQKMEFQFKGYDFLVDYAKYVIEYLESKFNPKKN